MVYNKYNRNKKKDLLRYESVLRETKSNQHQS